MVKFTFRVLDLYLKRIIYLLLISIFALLHLNKALWKQVRFYSTIFVVFFYEHPSIGVVVFAASPHSKQKLKRNRVKFTGSRATVSAIPKVSGKFLPLRPIAIKRREGRWKWYKPGDLPLLSMAIPSRKGFVTYWFYIFFYM